MSEKSDGWSSTFVRTRAELFVCGCLIAAISFWDLDLTHVPLLGFELSSAPSKYLILALVDVFFLYCFLSLALRFRIEIRQDINLPSVIDAQIEELRGTIAELSNFSLESHTKTLSAQLQTIENLLASADAARLDLQTEELSQRARKAGSWWVQLIAQELPGEAQRTELQNFLAEPHVPYPEKLRADVAPRLQEVIYLTKNSLEAHRKSSSVDYKVVAAVGAVSTQVSETSNWLNDLVKRQNSMLQASVTTVEVEIAKLSDSLSGWRSMESFERNLMGFWLPTCCAVGLAVAGNFVTIGAAILAGSAA